MPEPIRVTVEFDSKGVLQLREGADALDTIHNRIQSLVSVGAHSSRVLRAAENDLNRFASAMRYRLGGALSYTNSLFESFYTMLGSFFRYGIYTAISQLGLLSASLYGVGKAFLSINERFGELDVTLKSVYGSMAIARRLRDEIARISIFSPLRFQDIAEVSRAFAAMPALSARIGREAQSAPSGQKTFLSEATRLVEQMVAFRPDKTAQDATFAIREAVTGELRSLIRRFEFPSSLLVRASGRSLQELKLDPEAMFKAIKGAFDRIITPSAIEELGRQPKFLFQNLVEQVLEFPLLRIGKAGEGKGQDLYRSIIEFFFNQLNATADFVQSKFEPQAVRISTSLKKFFFTAIGVADNLVEKVLTAFHFDKLENFNASKLERIFLLFEGLINRAADNLPEFVNRIEGFMERFIPVVQKLTNVVVTIVKTIARAFESSPFLGVGVLFAIRNLPLLFRGLSEALSATFIDRLTKARLAAGANFALSQSGASFSNSGGVATTAATLQVSSLAATAVAQVLQRNRGLGLNTITSPITSIANPAQQATIQLANSNQQLAAQMLLHTQTLRNVQRYTAQGYNQSPLNPFIFTRPGVQGAISAVSRQPGSYPVATGPGIPIPPVTFLNPRGGGALPAGFTARSTVGSRGAGLLAGLAPAGAALTSLVASVATTIIVTGIIALISAAAYKFYESNLASAAARRKETFYSAGFTPDFFNSIELQTQEAANFTKLIREAQEARVSEGGAPFKEPTINFSKGLIESVQTKFIREALLTIHPVKTQPVEGLSIAEATKRLIDIQSDMQDISKAISDGSKDAEVILRSSKNSLGENISVGARQLTSVMGTLKEMFEDGRRELEKAESQTREFAPFATLSKELDAVKQSRLDTLSREVRNVLATADSNFAGLLDQEGVFVGNGLVSLRAKVRNAKESIFTNLISTVDSELTELEDSLFPANRFEKALTGSEIADLSKSLTEVLDSFSKVNKSASLDEARNHAIGSIDSKIAELTDLLNDNPNNKYVEKTLDQFKELRTAVANASSRGAVSQAFSLIEQEAYAVRNELTTTSFKIASGLVFNALRNINEQSPAQRNRTANQIQNFGLLLGDQVQPFSAGSQEAMNRFVTYTSNVIKSLPDASAYPTELRPQIFRQNAEKSLDIFAKMRDALGDMIAAEAQSGRPYKEVVADYSAATESVNSRIKILKTLLDDLAPAFDEINNTFAGLVNRLQDVSRTRGIAGSASRLGLVSGQLGRIDALQSSLISTGALPSTIIPANIKDVFNQGGVGSRTPFTSEILQQKALFEIGQRGVAGINAAVSSGKLTTTEASVYIDYFHQLSASAEEAIAAITGVGDSMQTLGQGIASTFDEFRTRGRDLTDVGKTIANGLADVSNTLVDVMVDSKNAGQAFQEFGYNLLKTATNALANKLVQQLLGSLFSGGGGQASTYGTIANVLGVAIGGAGFDSGGLIPGPPSSKDNRLYKVATGEYIIPADVVSRLGASYFDIYKNGGIPTLPVKIDGSRADGGLVGSSVVTRSGSSSTSINVPLNIEMNFANNGQATTTQSGETAKSRENGMKEVAKSLQVAVQLEIQRQMRQGGELRRLLGGY